MGCNHNLTSGTPRKPIGTIHSSTRTHRKVQKSKDAQANSDSNGLPLLLHIVLLKPDYFNKIVHGKRNLMIPKCLTKTYPCHKLVTCAIFPWHSQWEPILIGYWMAIVYSRCGFVQNRIPLISSTPWMVPDVNLSKFPAYVGRWHLQVEPRDRVEGKILPGNLFFR